MKNLLKIVIFITVLVVPVKAQTLNSKTNLILEEINKIIEDAKIPDIRIVILQDTGQVLLKCDNGSDVEVSNIESDSNLYELGSTSKAFTALAILKLEKEHKIGLNDNISQYIPWFITGFRGDNYEITLKQLLHHTSGIPWRSISMIPQGCSNSSLENTVKAISGIELENKPGSKYDYATVNYDILGFIIELVTGKKYEDYMTEEIFRPLGMNSTTVGYPVDPMKMTKGKKIGFFKARDYEPPQYRGNWPAGYVISNSCDISKWMKFQLGMETGSGLAELLEISHIKDESVPPVRDPVFSYAAGWQISLEGDSIIYHEGLNPNFSSYIGFIPGKKTGVAILANSNSDYTGKIGEYIIKSLAGDDNQAIKQSRKNDDKIFSFISILLTVFFFGLITLIIYACYGVLTGKITLSFPSRKKLINFLIRSVAIPFIFYGIYILPHALIGFDWKTAVVWTPVSFTFSIIMVLLNVTLIYLVYFISLFITVKGKYGKSIPMVIILSLMSGLANSIIIFIVINSINSDIKLIYLLYYFLLAMAVYILGRRAVQIKLLKINFQIIYDIRIKLIEKIFSASYQKFEKIERGRVYATLNDDTNYLGGAVNFLVIFITSVITIISAFIYLALISFWPTLLTLGVILIIASIYYFVSEYAAKYFNVARDTSNKYMSLLNGMLDGFKELCISRFKKNEYKKDIEDTIDDFRKNNIKADIYYINAMMVGESFLIFVLGFVSFVFPKMFPDIQSYVLMSFLMVLLYLIGPINGVLQTIPVIIRLKISWERIQEFIKNVSFKDKELLPLTVTKSKIKTIDKIKLENIVFEYEGQGEHDKFCVGPISFEAKKGEILFIIGGNGSGKTTLANLITGLYRPDSGSIMINDEEMEGFDLGENFSVVFGDYNLFSKLYCVDTKKNENQIDEYFKKFYLQDKVHIEEGAFSTVKLSNGQRKRLAVIKCILEDSPIFLFDEAAADQDPDFKRYFYRDLLLQMKKEGKIIIAITHDDHYFDVADKIIKLDSGKLDFTS